jgi:hypothetical protein
VSVPKLGRIPTRRRTAKGRLIAAVGVAGAVLALVAGGAGAQTARATTTATIVRSVASHPVPGPFGRVWQVETTPNLAAKINELRSVSCLGRVFCMAIDTVGSAPSGPGSIRSVAEQRGLSGWSLVPLAGGAVNGRILGSVSCPALDACVAVGAFASTRLRLVSPLVERWNGARWTIQPTPPLPARSFGELTSVSCATTSSCLAVGVYSASPGSNTRALSEVWDGRSWRRQAPARSVGVDLLSVSCSSSTACTAVGFGGNRAFGLANILRWNGAHWARQHGAGTLTLGVSCPSARWCVAIGIAIGSLSSPKPGFRPSIETWNGQIWTQDKIALPPGAAGDTSTLTAVSCRAKRSCIAVGNYNLPHGRAGQIAEILNATGWHLQTFNNTSRRLDAISCPAVEPCIAVGGHSDKTLAERS